MIDITAMFPVIVSADLTAQNKFYTSHFGFEAVFMQTDFFLHMLQPSTGIQLGFLAPEHASQPAFLQRVAASEGWVISFEVDDANKAYQLVKDMSLPIVFECKEEAWGQNHFMIKDPAGNIIDIVENVMEK